MSRYARIHRHRRCPTYTKGAEANWEIRAKTCPGPVEELRQHRRRVTSPVTGASRRAGPPARRWARRKDAGPSKGLRTDPNACKISGAAPLRPTCSAEHGSTLRRWAGFGETEMTASSRTGSCRGSVSDKSISFYCKAGYVGMRREVCSRQARKLPPRQAACAGDGLQAGQAGVFALNYG